MGSLANRANLFMWPSLRKSSRSESDSSTKFDSRKMSSVRCVFSSLLFKWFFSTKIDSFSMKRSKMAFSESGNFSR